MKKLGETMEIFGFLGFLLSASGIDSGSKANLIVLDRVNGRAGARYMA